MPDGYDSSKIKAAGPPSMAGHFYVKFSLYNRNLSLTKGSRDGGLRRIFSGRKTAVAIGSLGFIDSQKAMDW
ncbi:MAG TPA: hypothetical protein PLC07_00655 [Bacillota bacterium]|nr:hypothetical protein [Bacillota bacterium]